ncbi:tetratricopeptide repeat protein [Rubrivirga sp. IMCC45206]|uniref:serine/threonine-protein kinase n=1 Tax=Rubrivirga sp. IMCC45206 TaxID=3391614 RepID=UPI003990110A
MPPVPWTRIETLFEEALRHAPDARLAWLREQCGADAALFDRVAALLDADAAPAPVLGGRALAALYGEDALAGQRVGPWRVAEHLGVGGMGTVYRAERADGFEQTVALKLIKRGMDTDAVLRRFQAERRILARLEHPGIARLVDGGVGAGGRPYLAMEYVEGEPITDYCDRRQLGVEARLRLVADACEAVAYAHQRLVVHRDLKPSNLLVADTPDGPRVKLLDFGIAKVLEAEAADDLTRTGQRPFTPSYAAPEQLRGGAITTATDVYGLGAVLYRLLAGTRPTPAEGRSPAQVEIAVLTEEPTLPSRVVRGQAAIAQARGTTPEALARAVAGDLDGIVLRALRKDPAERYADARALLDDLRRYREGLPVAARPPSRAYRARKFVGRHRAALTAAGAGVLAVALVTALAFARVGAERDLARAEAAKAAEVSGFLADLFADTDPAETPGAEAFVRDLLARGTARIDADLADEPALHAQMLAVVGRVYRRRGLYAAADSALARALALRHELVGDGHPDVAAVLNEIGLLREDEGAYAEAEHVLVRALAIHRAHPDGDPLLLANTLHNLAFANLRLGRYAEGEAQIRQALDLKEAAYGEPHPDLAYSLNILGDLLTFRERYAEAEAVHLRALAMRRALLGPDHLDVSSTLHNLAATYRDQERWADAEPLYRDALRISEAHYGPDHGDPANTRSQLALVIGMQGRDAEAEALHRQAVAAGRRAFGSSHPILASIFSRRGAMLDTRGRPGDALPLFREAAAMTRARLGPDHPDAIRGALRVAVTEAHLGRDADAERGLERVNAACAAAEEGPESCHQAVADARALVAEARPEI